MCQRFFTKTEFRALLSFFWVISILIFPFSAVRAIEKMPPAAPVLSDNHDSPGSENCRAPGFSILPKPCEGAWSGTVSAVITGTSNAETDIYDLGKKTETTDYKLTVDAKISFGAVSEKVEYSKKIEGKTAGKQFRGTNAQPQYAEYCESLTTVENRSGSGGGVLTV
jgi:hypothetical protein